MMKPYSTEIVDIDKCAERIGSRFDLILIATTRARELKRGSQKMVSTHNSNIVTALREIEHGHIGRDYLKRMR